MKIIPSYSSWAGMDMSQESDYMHVLKLPGLDNPRLKIQLKKTEKVHCTIINTNMISILMRLRIRK